MNASEWGKSALRDNQHALPADHELLTGREFVVRYLEPLARLPQLADSLRTRTLVHRIGRRESLKTERIGDRRRAEEPFRLAIGSPLRHMEADVVLDCSGTYNQHNWLGAGGIPCPGEFEVQGDRIAMASDLSCGLSIEYGLPEIVGVQSSGYADRTTLVAGSGFSAATNVLALSLLQVDRPDTRAIWLTRGATETPLPRITDDPLLERDRLAARVNELARSGRAPVEWKPGCCVRRLEMSSEEGRWIAFVESQSGSVEQVHVDHIIANVGYRPDRSLYEELQVHECYATQGPMKLAGKLLGETSADCLAQTSHGPDSLRNPEPNFFILGAKSYGRNSNFLLQVGLQQIRDVFTLIDRDR
jgi:hypothetical protein